MVFTSHSRKKISFIAPTSFNFLTSCLIASTCFLANLLSFYFFSVTGGSTFNWCVMKVRSTLGTSYGFHTNTSKFCTNDRRTSTWSSISKLFPIQKYLSVEGEICIWTNSSTLSAPVKLSVPCNCYNCSFSTCSFYLTLWFIVATKHYLGTFWST